MSGYNLEELLGKSKAELVRLLLEKDDLPIPATVFSTKLGPLEGLVAYLKDQKKLSVREIALRLDRSKQTIWTTYYKSKRFSLVFEKTSVTIPLSSLSKKNASILEVTCYYMHSILGLKYAEIAKLLNRDIRTIWTCAKRFEAKNPAHKKITLKKINEEEKR